MFPRRSVIVTRAAAGGFGLVVGLSLLSGAGEWTAAFRGLLAALACAFLAPSIYAAIDAAVHPATAAGAAVAAADSATKAPAAAKPGAPKPAKNPANPTKPAAPAKAPAPKPASAPR